MRQLRRTDDAGVTLIELVVTVMLLGAVMTLVGSLFVTSLRTQTTVRNATAASREAQSISDSLANGIRNASAFRVTVPSGTDQLLVAKVADAAAATISWRCIAWYYSATAKTLRSTQLVVPYTAPTSEPTTWTLLGTGITPRTGTTVFSVSGQTLSFAFTSAASGTAPVALTGSAYARTGVAATTSCY